MTKPYDIVTLTDGRRGYIYQTRITGTPIFQPIDSEGLDDGNPELLDEDHEVASETVVRKDNYD